MRTSTRTCTPISAQGAGRTCQQHHSTSSRSSSECQARSSLRPALYRRSAHRFKCATGDVIAEHRATYDIDPGHALHWQEFEARRLLKKHPLLSQVVVKSSSPDTTRLQTLRPAGTTLASFHGKLWEGFSSGKHEARIQLPIVVEAVAACVVTALQQLGQQGAIHGCLNMEALLVSKDPLTKTLIVQLANFGSSCVRGTALCPGARDLATAPPEMRLAMHNRDYITRAGKTHDMWGLGIILLDLLSPTGVPESLRAHTYGIRGAFSDPLNFAGLVKARDALGMGSLMYWVERHYPAGTTNLLSGNLLDFISKCLSPASERWTADQAALHPLIRRRMSEMPEVCTRLALEQEAVSGAIYMKSLKIFRSVPKPAPMPTPAPADNSKSSEEAKPTAVSTWLAPGKAATDEAPSCGCPKPLPPKMGIPGYSCTTGAFTYTERLVHHDHELYTPRLQMVMAARHLPLHPAVQGVAAASPTCGDYLHLRLPAPTSMGLWEYVQVLKERHAANPRLYKRALDQTAKAVLACGVMALQHLQAHGVVHMAFTMQSFVLVSDSDEEGPIFQVADFDVSRLCGSALCPGAVELSAVPPELMTIKLIFDPAAFTAAAHPIVHDVWGLGMVLLELYSPVPLVPMCAEMFGVEGPLSAPHNYSALEPAVDELSCMNILDWVESCDPNALDVMPGDCRELIERCLCYQPQGRCTVNEMAKHPIVLTTLAKLAPAYAAIAEAQQRLHAAMDADQDLEKMLARQPTSPRSLAYLQHSCTCACLGGGEAASSDSASDTLDDTASSSKAVPSSTCSSPASANAGDTTSSTGLAPTDSAKALAVPHRRTRCKKVSWGSDAAKKSCGSQSGLVVAVGGSRAVRAVSGVEGVSSSSSSPMSAVSTPAVAGDTSALQRQGSSSSSSGKPAGSGAAPSSVSRVVPAAVPAWRLSKQPLVASVAMPVRVSSSSNSSGSSSSEQVSWGARGLSQAAVDTVHNRLAVAPGCKSADDLVAGCYLVTGEMPRPMLLVQCAPTLTCPQSEVVQEPPVASSGSSSSSVVSAGGKVGRLMRAAGSVCRFFVRR